VRKQRNMSYIFSVLFVINLNWKKYCFFSFQNGLLPPPFRFQDIKNPI